MIDQPVHLTAKVANLFLVNSDRIPQLLFLLQAHLDKIYGNERDYANERLPFGACLYLEPTFTHFAKAGDTMTKPKYFNYWILAASALGLGVIVAASTSLGVWAGLRFAQPESSAASLPLELKAGTAARGKTMSMATGLIDGNVEGLFILDHLTGNLQCWLLNARTGAVGGIFRANVAQALATDKAGDPDYIMTTGNFFWNGGNAGNSLPAQSIVYVCDGTSGNVVGYSITYNKQSVLRGVAQAGTLNLVCQGSARDVVTRDQ